MWTRKHVEDPVAEAQEEAAQSNGHVPSEEVLERAISALAPPERLSDEDFSLFAPAFIQMQETERAFQAAQQEAQEAQIRAIAAKGAMQYVFSRLQASYFLGPADEIDQNGGIVRKADAL